jgi:hypothetical protein
VELLTLPGALIIADKMLDKKSSNAIETIPSSNTAKVVESMTWYEMLLSKYREH